MSDTPIVIYKFDHVTLEYTGESEEWTPPNAWTALPGGATVFAPPVAKEGFALVLNQECSGWDYVPDHRGKKGYLPDGTMSTITSLGELPEGWSETVPPIVIDNTKASLRLAVNKQYDAAIGALVSSKGLQDIDALNAEMEGLNSKREGYFTQINSATTIDELMSLRFTF